MKLNLTVDFEEKELKGYVELRMLTLKRISLMDLDMVGLEVEKVEV